MLRKIIGRWPNAKALYPLLEWKEESGSKVLIYPYEDSEPYRGGYGPGLVELMAECHRYRIICRNIHPKNLRVVGTSVRLIDYGGDLYLTDNPAEFDGEFTAMCRRAYLSWRWWHRDDLAELMRRSLTEHEMPELEGFEWFIDAVWQVLGLRSPEDPVLTRASHLKPRRVLDYGCGKAKQAILLADEGAEVIVYDPDPDLQPRLSTMASPKLHPEFTAASALATGPFDLVICRRVACLVDDEQLTALLADLRQAVSREGRVLFALCHPAYTPRCTTPEATPHNTERCDPEAVFTWKKDLRTTGRVLTEYHRPEHRLQRLLRRAGLTIVDRHERLSIDLVRFEPIADMLAFELVPAEPPSTTLLIKACAMEVETLGTQVRHIVSQLEQPRGFAEILLVLDAKPDGFLRDYTVGDYAALRRNAHTLLDQGWVDRIVEAMPAGPATAVLNERWMGLHSHATHCANGAQLAPTLAGFEACRTRYVLHADLDVMICRHDPSHDYLGDMLQVLAHDHEAVTVAFNIANEHDRCYTPAGNTGPWRTESRIGLLDLARIKSLLPLPNSLLEDRPQFPWYRALDRAIRQGKASSWRGGDRRSFFVHPPNAHKADTVNWFLILDQIERGMVPTCQHGQVDLAGVTDDWLMPERFEPFVFVVAGRNVPPNRFRRCLASALRQTRKDWGMVVIDDASYPAWTEEIATICSPHMDRITLLRQRIRRGLLANTVDAIRNRCSNPDSVIVTLDADDCLIGNQVLETLAAHYAGGADVTVGSMLRTDRHRHYPVNLEAPRSKRGGNVWQHLRSFRKALFDAIPDAELRLNGEYVELATDWAYMLPIVEMAQRPCHIYIPLYLHEPGGTRNAERKRRREAIIAQIVSRLPLT